MAERLGERLRDGVARDLGVAGVRHQARQSRDATSR
jgi:hypothetical protein